MFNFIESYNKKWDLIGKKDCQVKQMTDWDARVGGQTVQHLLTQNPGRGQSWTFTLHMKEKGKRGTFSNFIWFNHVWDME